MAFVARPTAIVTGAARGIGFGISERLLKLAYRVILFDINEQMGRAAEEKLSRKYGLKDVTFVKGDVSSQWELKNAFEKAKAEFGEINLLINNAAIVAEKDPARTVAVNLLGPIYGCELALKYMGTSSGGKGGLVINISSIAGFLPYPDAPASVATKHALIGLTRSYGHNVHYKNNKVSFMAICPHYTDTMGLREAETLNVYNPQGVESMLMPVERVTDGIVKLLDDKRNGSILLLLRERLEYVEIPEELRKIPTAATY